jgi:hypothetical protein
MLSHLHLHILPGIRASRKKNHERNDQRRNYKLKYKPLPASEDAAEACISNDKTHELENVEVVSNFVEKLKLEKHFKYREWFLSLPKRIMCTVELVYRQSLLW